MAGGPLDGVRVVDLTDLRGAMCARVLADLGADVLRVAPVTEVSTAHRYRNANKRQHTLELPSQLDELHALLAQADVLVENLGPATPWFDREDITRRHRHLVVVALADLGLRGPRSQWRLEPLAALAASGALFATGFRDRPPTALPGHVAHDCASVYGAIAAVAGLLDRDRRGVGQLAEVSVQEAALAGLTPWSVALNDYVRVNPYLPTKGTRNADGSYWVMPAKDGWVRTVIGSQRQWLGFLSLVRNDELLSGPEWEQTTYRMMNGDVIRLVAGSVLIDRTRAELFVEALATGCTLGILNLPLEFVGHPQTAARGSFVATGFEGLGDAPFARPPFRLSVTPASVDRAASLVDRRDEPFGVRADLPEAPGGGGLLFAPVRVVEFGMAAVIPELAGVLSELGADVVKIESNAHPDVLRTSAGPNVNTAFTYNCESRGRSSVCLDITTPQGRQLALDLCAEADFVVENFRGGVLDRLGLGHADVAAVNPAVVYVSSQGYGRGGPLGEMPAFGPLNAGFAGLHHLWSDPEAPYPCGASLNHPDHIAGKLLAVAALAAYRHRRLHGVGQYVEMGQTDAAAYLLGDLYLDAALDGVDLPLQGNAHRTQFPHGVYQGAGDDRWVAIVTPDDASYARLAAVTGAPESYVTFADRIAHRDEIDAAISAWTASRDVADAAAELQAAGVSAMPVMGPDDQHADPHLSSRAFIVTLHHPEVGVEHHVGNPIRFSDLPQRTADSAPLLGVHTQHVLESWLGIDETRYRVLAEAKIAW